MQAVKTSMAERGFELRFSSLSMNGRAYAFPCDSLGNVRLEELGERVLDAYLRASARVGSEFLFPAVCPAGGSPVRDGLQAFRSPPRAGSGQNS